MLEFVCGYCGSAFDTPVARARCELDCEKKIRQKAEEEAKQRLAEEKEARLAEVRALEKDYVEKRSKYIEDYGSYMTEGIDNLTSALYRIWR